MRITILVSLLLAFAIPADAYSLCDVIVDGHAKCDNVSDDSEAIQSVLNEEACSPVLIPKGALCVSRALNISQMSGRTLSIEGSLIIWRTPATYSTTKNNNMFLSATNFDGSWTGSELKDFTLSGGGSIVGGGAAWWPLGSTVNRPRTLWIPNGTNVVVSNLTLIDSPSWNLGLRGNNILVENVVVQAGLDSCEGYLHAPNTDGANVGGHNITVRNMWVHNGDDCIPVTTGNDGTSSSILIQNVSCFCGTNGAVIYNQGGEVSGVLARNMTVTNTNQGAGIKLARIGRNATGGLVTNVSWSGITIVNPRYAALYVNVFQEDAQPPCTLPPDPDLDDWLTAQDLHFDDITATVPNGQAAGCFRCTPKRPCAAEFDRVTVKQQNGATAPGFVCLNMDGTVGPHGSKPACA